MKMASKASIALFLTLNVLFFSMVSSNYVPVVPGVPVPVLPGVPVPVLPGVPSVPSQKGTCPIDALKLGVCANVLNLVKVKVGSPPTLPCCSLINGLADLEAAVCLCTALKANVLGINLDIPVSLSIILNNCGRKNRSFQCP